MERGEEKNGTKSTTMATAMTLAILTKAWNFTTESQPESFNIDIYVPPDERFRPKKLSEFISNVIQVAMLFVIPDSKAVFINGLSHFEFFNEIQQLFTTTRVQGVEEWVVKILKPETTTTTYEKIFSTRS
ncbi:linoleate 9S-lipoxygenase 6-like [Olea europaea subsp. europaea]|uniref:Linoleate 9S-lipoxygenase 6-like n=1 Tax=Olea europaea subsp. europaea TaxID=158383 RepID=A0A8S0PE07_OLEEU|nr:linoleate 9S-lipoxygenase 6-like [Olea europaea subsp. europaea]